MVASSKLSKPRDALAPRAAMAEELRRKVGRSINARHTVTLAGSVRDDRFVDEAIRRDGRRSA